VRVKVISFCLLVISLFYAGCTDKKNETNKNDILTFRVNNNHSGVFAGKGIESPNGFKWIFKTDGPIRTSPAVYNNTVYFGSSDGNFYAVDFNSGKEKWSYKSGGAIQSTPAIAGDHIFFCNRNGILYSLSTKDGKENWKINLGKDLPLQWGFDYYLSSPVIENGTIYIGSGSGIFYSIEFSTGSVSWEYNCNARIRSTAAVSNNLVLFGDMSGRFYALGKEKGKLVWKFEVEGMKYDNSKFGFDRKSIMSSGSVSGKNVVFGSRDGNLYNLDLKTGKEIWKVGNGTSWIITSPAVYNGVVYDGSSDARFVRAVDLKTGDELWKFNTHQAVWSSPAVSANSLYFGDFSGALYSLDLQTGKENWSYKLLDGFIASSPVVVANNILIGGDDGSLYCLNGKEKSKSENIKRAVFYEPTKEFNWFHNGVDEGIKNYFEKSGYEVLDKNSLAKFFKEQINSKSKSVVVFASNKIPHTVFDESENNLLIKEYLTSGGKVVFLGANPLAYIFDKKSGKLAGIDFRIPSKVFGVDYQGELTDALKGWFYVKTTAEGNKWGLTGWWVGIASVDKSQVSTVLALDENGNAAAWIKNYGGDEGTGLVQLWVDRDRLSNLSEIKAAAEFRL